MSVVILGGNECMVRNYQDLCKSYDCRAKVFAKPRGGLRRKLGHPDLLVVFTNTMSHKILRCAMSELKGQDMVIAHVPSSSIAALCGVLEEYVG